MMGVDDMVGNLVDTLRATGRLDDTYIFFSSDNGFHLGSHRMATGKTTPFEETIKVPMVVRGPGVEPDSAVGAMGSTVDFGPTFAALAGARTPAFVEGRSLVPLLRGYEPDRWRHNALIEFTRPENRDSGAQTPVPAYTAIRTEEYTYVQYDTGEIQLYDLDADPDQLYNLASIADPGLLMRLRTRLLMLRACSGASCRTADSYD